MCHEVIAEEEGFADYSRHGFMCFSVTHINLKSLLFTVLHPNHTAVRNRARGIFVSKYNNEEELEGKYERYTNLGQAWST